MHTRLVAAGVVAACVGVAFGSDVAARRGAQGSAVPVYPTEQQMAQSPVAQRHVANATAIAGTDLVTEAENACQVLGPQVPALTRQAAGQAFVPTRRLEPVKIFDNLYYVGSNFVGAFAITTSDGIILLDTLNSPQEAEEILVEDLRTLGLDPTTVKHAIIGHGHVDHFGGAPYFQEQGVRISLTAADWDLMERPSPPGTPEAAAFVRRLGVDPTTPRPRRDGVLTDGETVTLGDTSVTILATPGHTDGSIGVLFPVRDEGQAYNALLLSGANQTPTPASLASFTKALTTAKAAAAAVLLNGHPGLFGDELEWFDTIRENPGGPNPFVYGESRFARYIDIMIECASARIAAMAYAPL